MPMSRMGAVLLALAGLVTLAGCATRERVVVRDRPARVYAPPVVVQERVIVR
jgi:hypothetical protein